MNVLVIGASGFIGRKLVERLALDGKVGNDEIAVLTLADAVKPNDFPESNTIHMKALQVDITDASSVQELLEDSPSVIFHLAAIVSGQAESDFDLGYKVNVDGTRLLLDAIKNKEGYKPRLVFTSSLAVYGPPLPAIVPDDYATTPRGSYGSQKAIAELLLEDYTRKGFVDAVSIRFPTIAIRPGKPNAAASSFISGIIREPLNGQEATLPVNLDFRHTVASPKAAVAYLLRAATYQPVNPGDRTLQMPGISLLVEEMIEALERVAGKEVTSLIKHKPDPFVIGIVDSWPKNFEAQRALELGFVADKSYDDIIIDYMKDEGMDYSKYAAAAPAAADKKDPLGLRGFSHISINVPDIDEALTFYHNVLGFEKMQGGKQWGDFDFREFSSEPFAKNAGFQDGQLQGRLHMDVSPPPELESRAHALLCHRLGKPLQQHAQNTGRCRNQAHLVRCGQRQGRL